MPGFDFTYGFVVHRSSLLNLLPDKGKDDPASYAQNSGPIFPIDSTLSEIGLSSTNVLSWASWGPEVTHWYEIDGDMIQTRACYGQTMIMYDAEIHRIVRWDFNPNSVRKAKLAGAAQTCDEGQEDSSPEPGKHVIICSTLNAGNWFEWPIESSLPFVETKHARDKGSSIQTFLFNDNLVIAQSVG